MSLKYVPFLTINSGNVSSMDFSVCGRILAVVDFEGRISLWDMTTGNCYHPTLVSGCQGTSASLWVNDRYFVCGLSDGSVGTCNILGEGTLALVKHLQVKFDKKQVTESSIISLSYHPSIGRLAVGSVNTARILFSGASGWEHESRIPDPQPTRNLAVQIVDLAWVPESESKLVIAYKRHGVMIWDTDTLTLLRIFSHGDILCRGTFCSTSETFVAIDDAQKVVLYHLGLGFRWLPKLDGVLSIKSIHRNTGFVAGGRGVAQLVDIPLRCISQTLRQDSWSSEEELGAISAFQDKTENEFMIATASGRICTVWKAEPVD